MTSQKIAKLIKKSIKELKERKKLPQFSLPEIEVEVGEEKIYGDYTTNVAFLVAKKIEKEPLEVAEIIKDQLSKITKGLKLFEKIEVKKPGFINFFLSKEYLQKELAKILKKGEKFGKLNIGRGQKVNIEFISANPTGPLHIGNGRGAFFGESLANILEKAGYKVIREYYINDAKNSLQIKELGKTALGKGRTYLNDYLKAKIKSLKPKLKKITDEGEAGYLLAKEIQKDIRNFIEKKLKIKFNNWVSEEDLYRKSKVEKIYKFLKKRNLVYKKEGAEWLKVSKFGALKDEVIVRKTGQPTYFLSDIAYHKDKFDRHFKKIINIWGADHQGHVPKIKAIAKILGYKGELDILISQVVKLKRGKISKRKGEIVTLEDLIEEVGLDVARFFYLSKSLDTHMEFDLELAKEQSGKNPVYYIQYAHARIWSILRKIKDQKPKIEYRNLKLLTHLAELELIKQLIRFPELIAKVAKDYQIQQIPQYALNLATSFHQFYRDCRVISKDKNLSLARLALILATKEILKSTLNLMGISAPKRM